VALNNLYLQPVSITSSLPTGRQACPFSLWPLGLELVVERGEGNYGKMIKLLKK